MIPQSTDIERIGGWAHYSPTRDTCLQGLEEIALPTFVLPELDLLGRRCGDGHRRRLSEHTHVGGQTVGEQGKRFNQGDCAQGGEASRQAGRAPPADAAAAMLLTPAFTLDVMLCCAVLSLSRRLRPLVMPDAISVSLDTSVSLDIPPSPPSPEVKYDFISGVLSQSHDYRVLINGEMSIDQIVAFASI